MFVLAIAAAVVLIIVAVFVVDYECCSSLMAKLSIQVNLFLSLFCPLIIILYLLNQISKFLDVIKESKIIALSYPLASTCNLISDEKIMILQHFHHQITKPHRMTMTFTSAASTMATKIPTA